MEAVAAPEVRGRRKLFARQKELTTEAQRHREDKKRNEPQMNTEKKRE